MSEDKKRTFYGVPLEEARKIIMIYQETHRMPTKDYIEGFEEGCKYTKELYDESLDNAIRMFTSKLWREENGKV